MGGGGGVDCTKYLYIFKIGESHDLLIGYNWLIQGMVVVISTLSEVAVVFTSST